MTSITVGKIDRFATDSLHTPLAWVIVEGQEILIDLSYVPEATLTDHILIAGRHAVALVESVGGETHPRVYPQSHHLGTLTDLMSHPL